MGCCVERRVEICFKWKEKSRQVTLLKEENKNVVVCYSVMFIFYSSFPTSPFTNSKKAAVATSVSASSDGSKQHYSVPVPQLEPARSTNKLLNLHRSRGVEVCDLRETFVPGMILARDFEFLRWREDCQTTF